MCPRLTFNIPNWIPNLLAPKYEFETTYAQITSIVRKMKSKGSDIEQKNKTLSKKQLILIKYCMRTFTPFTTGETK